MSGRIPPSPRRFATILLPTIVQKLGHKEPRHTSHTIITSIPEAGIIPNRQFMLVEDTAVRSGG